uniref:bifunctional DNA primase/polymerase n=1 Tax=Nonomuraea pusilla TaxID=46177 RepID=UPI0006E32045|nr:bifunctional DNA primase/polymerase [Nonomuraea pusilla]
MPTTLIRHALAAAARGWYVFPLTPGDKRPLRGFTDWERHATTDPERIHAMWTRAPFNVGIACGPSGLVVLDLDRPHPGESPPPAWNLPGVHEGADVLAALCEQAGQPLPLETFTVRTGRGGTHLYFAAPSDVVLGNTAGRLGWKIDTRARGGYVVGPGSVASHGTYEVLHAPNPAPLPTWLTERLTTPAVPKADTFTGAVPAAYADVSAYTLAALRGEVETVLSAATGSRNNTLNAAAFRLGRLVAAGYLPRHLAEACLHHAAELAGLGFHETAATIRSGLDAGQRHPRRAAA